MVVVVTFVMVTTKVVVLGVVKGVVGYVVVLSALVVILVDRVGFGVFSFIVVGLMDVLIKLVLLATTVGVCLVSGVMVVVCSGIAE